MRAALVTEPQPLCSPGQPPMHSSPRLHLLKSWRSWCEPQYPGVLWFWFWLKQELSNTRVLASKIFEKPRNKTKINKNLSPHTSRGEYERNQIHQERNEQAGQRHRPYGIGKQNSLTPDISLATLEAKRGMNISGNLSSKLKGKLIRMNFYTQPNYHSNVSTFLDGQRHGELSTSPWRKDYEQSKARENLSK